MAFRRKKPQPVNILYHILSFIIFEYITPNFHSILYYLMLHYVLAVIMSDIKLNSI